MVKHRIVVPCVGDADEDYKRVSARYASNRIKTTKYTFLNFIPKNLFEQFHRAANLYFLFIAGLNWIPAVEAFRKEVTMLPLLFVLVAIAVKDAWGDYKKYVLDKKINNLITLVYCSKENAFVERVWKHIKVGDFVRLVCNEEIPADMVLIYSSDPNGICHIETANLDGETNLKRREVVRGYETQDSELHPEAFSGKIECEIPNKNLNAFQGFLERPDEHVELSRDNLLMRGCTIRNTEVVIGIVVYAGHETKAMLNTASTRYKQSKLEKRLNQDIVWCVVLLFTMCAIVAVGHGIWLGNYSILPTYSVPGKDGKPLSPWAEAFYRFWSTIILLQILIPISLYVSIEFVKWGHILFIENDSDLYDEKTNKGVHCGSPTIAEDLGQIEYIFTDKTGTLTENKMVFRRCSIVGQEYGHEANAKRLEEYEEGESEDEDATISAPLSRQHLSKQRMSSLRVTTVRPSVASLQPPGKPLYRLSALNRISLIRMYGSSSVLGIPWSMQVAFSSRLETDVVPDPQLVKKFNKASPNIYAQCVPSRLTPDTVYITEFFIALAICNTVVVSTEQQSEQPEPLPQDVLAAPAKMLPQLQSQVVLVTSAESNTAPLSPPSTPSEHSVSDVSDKEGQEQPSMLTTSPASVPPSPREEEAACLRIPAENRAPFAQPSIPELCYEAESPDEAALVHAAKAYKCTLQSRTPSQVTVEVGKLGTLAFQILHILPFDTERKRMSVVVRHPLSKQVVVYTKGADSVIMDLLESTDDRRKRNIKNSTQNHVREYARHGLRTLCIAMKVLSEDEYEEWSEQQHVAARSPVGKEELLSESSTRLETNLTLLGATGIEDRLQEGVPETIQKLQKAGIKIWMLTGDKGETAISIARSCKLLEPTDADFFLESDNKDACALEIDRMLEEINLCKGCPRKGSKDVPTTLEAQATPFPAGLVLEGPVVDLVLDECLQSKFLQLATKVRAVICCRATPLQKSRLVELVRKELKVMTLAVGDGANDISMIKGADIGIGISGQEGTQAAFASDFAIAQFRHLSKLLLVHGHWCYTRMASMALYFFCKNLAFVTLLFWYQFLCGFSGQPMTDYFSMIFFNLLYTSVPPAIFGILDQDVPAEVLMKLPELYKAGQRSEPYTPQNFGINLLDGFYQSSACFFLLFLTYNDTPLDVYSFGAIVTTIFFWVTMLHLVIESHNLNWIHFVGFFASITVYYMMTLLFGATCTLCNPPANPYWVMQNILRDPCFFVMGILVVAVALTPRLTFRAIERTRFPRPTV